jgi:lysine-specific demethylase 8/hypoxia-inducible factor 1-alpha inhibitor (HIF hydroxylase)
MTPVAADLSTASVAGRIPRVPFASLTREEFVARFRRPGRPVVLERVLDGPAWTLDQITAELDDTPRLVRRYGAERWGRSRRDWQDYATFETLPLSTYARMLADGSARRERVYMAQVDIAGTPLGERLRPRMDALAARCAMERFVPSDINLWLGPGGHTEPLHFDPADGTLIQTIGAKRTVLFAPAESDGLYPFPILAGTLPPWVSQVDIEAPDFVAFPALRAALGRRVEATLTPGDALYIPAYWWHENTGLGEGVVCSVNRFWRIRPFRRNFPCRLRRVALLLFLTNHLPVPVVAALNRAMLAARARSRA